MSRIGIHVASGKRTGIGKIFAAGPAVVVAVDQNIPRVPGAVMAFRTKRPAGFSTGADNPPNLLETPLENIPALANTWCEACAAVWAKNPGNDFYIVNNELDISSEDSAVRLNEFFLACMLWCDLHGYKAGICSFSTGCPSDDGGLTLEKRWEPLLPSVKYAYEHDHAIILHVHALNKGPLDETGRSIAYRHERTLEYFSAYGYRPRVILAEVSNGVGGIEPDLPTYLDQISKWDLHVMASPWKDQVLGGALYGFNDKETMSIQAATKIGDLIASHPNSTEPTPVPVTPPAPVEWDKIVVLVPQSIHESTYVSTAIQLGYPTKTEVAFSAESAFDWPQHAKTLKVIVVNPREWGGAAALVQWAQDRFGKLPTTIEYREI